MNTTTRPPRRRGWATCLAIVAVALASFISAAFASSASAAVVWTSEVFHAPSNLPPGGRGIVRVVAANEGDTASMGFPTVTVALPPGVTFGSLPASNFWSCSGAGDPQVVSCVHPFGSFFNVLPNSTVSLGEASAYVNLVVDVAADAPQGQADVGVTVASEGGGDSATQTHQVGIGSQQLPFGPTSGKFHSGTFDAGGTPYTQAGGHPDEMTTSFELNRRFIEPTPGDEGSYVRSIQAVANPRDVVVDLPAGFTGNPTSGPKCSDLGAVLAQTCPPSTQVGVVTLPPTVSLGARGRMWGVYNVVPDGRSPAQLAFASPAGVIRMTPELRSDGDYGLSIEVKNLTEADSIWASEVTIWGVPADPSHDAMRCARPNYYAQACIGYDEGGVPSFDPEITAPHPSNQPRKPFLSNPTECTGQPVVTSMHLASWDDGGRVEPDGDPDLTDPRWVSATANAPAWTGCDRLQFNPRIDVRPSDSAPSSPSGLEFDLTIPQNDDPDGLDSAHMKDATVVLPEGMVVNGASAGGLDACTSAQIGLVSKSPLRFTKLEPSCPLASKIGTVAVDTPLLDEPLTGGVFLARQKDNPFDSLLAMYVVVRGPGILVKLAGHVTPDPDTGRLTTTVVNNPQLPFESFRLRLKTGPRAPLKTPATCGSKEVLSTFVSRAGHSATPSDVFSVACPGNADAFDPRFTAGSTDATAGTFSPFTARMVRDFGKELGRIEMSLPDGLLANVRPVGVCSGAQIASSAGRPGVATQSAPSCPAASQIGTVTVGAGAGPLPFFPSLPGSRASGRVFLTGAHAGTSYSVPGAHQADYGLAIEVPAVAGPFDLGTVMVRAAVFVNPRTTQITAVSDRVPRILEGIPLDVRDLRVDIDRDRFTTTPTSCAEQLMRAEIRAQDETLAVRSTRYQAGDCAALGLAPRVSMKLSGRSQTRRGGNPALTVRLRQGGDQSNVKAVQAVLPRRLALDARNAAGDWLCEFEAGQRSSCPAGSRIGTAKAWSPLLKRPVSGPIYFVKGVRVDKRTGNRIRTLPTLLVKLSGEVDVELRATSRVAGGQLVSTFSGLPDARVSRVDMRVKGGAKRGILAVTGRTGSLCSETPVTALTVRGHNGKLYRKDIRMSTPCRKAKPKKR